ncbi:hypothetical protein PVAND_015955 [Polypedilum vanderplanki]|uniref:F-box domain-containing protein n=1 Tax=Polypedilum vanderplanki TaxID=319348 RepID=A0A9J6BER1_POLVA|nr:hypothetical protein PVAND_015955 [Polypedilum vanderplanki]
MKRKLEEDLNICDLSDDILLEIFDFFNKETIENLIKVCKRWRNLILSSSKLSRKPTMFNNFAIYFRRNISMQQKVESLLEKSKKFPYRNFCFSQLYNEDSHSLFDDFSKFMTESTNGRAEKIMFNEVPIFMIIKGIQVNSDSLVYLEINIDFQKDILPTNREINLKNLKTLKIFEFFSILKIIQCENLTDFSLHALPRPSLALKVLKNFLQNCEKIKILRLVDNFPKLDNVKFQIENFDLEINRRNSENFIENFQIFLNSQRKSLRNLNIKNSIVDYRKILNVINEETQLEKLHLCCYCDQNNRNKIMTANLTVKEMKFDVFLLFQGRLHGKVDPSQLIKTFKEFPSVEHLNIKGFYEDFSKIIRKANFSNLKSLHINSFNKINLHYHEVSFKNLETFIIDCIHNEETARLWIKMISFFPNVKHLIVKRWTYKPKNKQKQLKGSIIQKLFKCGKNVEKISIEECYSLSFGFFDYLKERNSNLKLLKIGVSKDEEIEAVKQKFYGSKLELIVTNYQEKLTSKWSYDPEYLKKRRI